MGDVRIRDATEADMPRVCAIYGHSVTTETASFELGPPSLQEITRRWRTLREASYPYIVAVNEAILVGYAYVGPYRPRPAYRSAVESTVYVAPVAQRLGIGRLLLEAKSLEFGEGTSELHTKIIAETMLGVRKQ